MILCLKCVDIYNFGLSKVLVARMDKADPQLITSVEEAIDMNRLFVKKSVVSVSTLREAPHSATGPVDGPNIGGNRAARSSVGSMDEEEEEDVELPADKGRRARGDQFSHNF